MVGVGGGHVTKGQGHTKAPHFEFPRVRGVTKEMVTHLGFWVCPPRRAASQGLNTTLRYKACGTKQVKFRGVCVPFFPAHGCFHRRANGNAVSALLHWGQFLILAGKTTSPCSPPPPSPVHWGRSLFVSSVASVAPYFFSFRFLASRPPPPPPDD